MSVPPITEGMVCKGGRNQDESQTKERPPAPAAITALERVSITGVGLPDGATISREDFDKVQLSEIMRLLEDVPGDSAVDKVRRLKEWYLEFQNMADGGKNTP